MSHMKAAQRKKKKAIVKYYEKEMPVESIIAF